MTMLLRISITLLICLSSTCYCAEAICDTAATKQKVRTAKTVTNNVRMPKGCYSCDNKDCSSVTVGVVEQLDTQEEMQLEKTPYIPNKKFNKGHLFIPVTKFPYVALNPNRMADTLSYGLMSLAGLSLFGLGGLASKSNLLDKVFDMTQSKSEIENDSYFSNVGTDATALNLPYDDGVVSMFDELKQIFASLSINNNDDNKLDTPEINLKSPNLPTLVSYGNQNLNYRQSHNKPSLPTKFDYQGHLQFLNQLVAQINHKLPPPQPTQQPHPHGQQPLVYNHEQQTYNPQVYNQRESTQYQQQPLHHNNVPVEYHAPEKTSYNEAIPNYQQHPENSNTQYHPVASENNEQIIVTTYKPERQNNRIIDKLSVNIPSYQTKHFPSALTNNQQKQTPVYYRFRNKIKQTSL